VLILDHHRDIADDLVDDQFQGLVLEDVPYKEREHPNTGVWVMRNTVMMHRFLEATEAALPGTGHWRDQEAVNTVLGWQIFGTGKDRYYGTKLTDPNEYTDGTAWLDLSWNQPYQSYAGIPDGPVEKWTQRPRVENPRFLHFFAMPEVSERIAAMTAFCQTIEGHPLHVPSIEPSRARDTAELVAK
jgi:hypothetical protein